MRQIFAKKSGTFRTMLWESDRALWRNSGKYTINSVTQKLFDSWLHVPYTQFLPAGTIQVYFFSLVVSQNFKLTAKTRLEKTCPPYLSNIIRPSDNRNLTVTVNVGNDNKLLLTGNSLKFSGDEMALSSWLFIVKGYIPNCAISNLKGSYFSRKFSYSELQKNHT